MLGRYNVGVVQIVRRRIQALMLPEDTLKHYFNYRETPAPNTKHQSPITKRFEFDSGADFLFWQEWALGSGEMAEQPTCRFEFPIEKPQNLPRGS
jgi:hypothetical protein